MDRWIERYVYIYIYSVYIYIYIYCLCDFAMPTHPRQELHMLRGSCMPIVKPLCTMIRIPHTGVCIYTHYIHTCIHTYNMRVMMYDV